MTRDNPDPIDIHVGMRLRKRREDLGVSQKSLAEALGVSFQQVQKYEKAKDRVSASRLYRIAHELGVPVGWFFDLMP